MHRETGGIPRPLLITKRSDWALADSTSVFSTATRHKSDKAKPAFPLISIVIPSYNTGEYLESAIRSILLQRYPRIQLIVIDACSQDNTKQILSHYSDYIDVILREPDAGQADAIQKGLQLATGDYFNWVNADDMLSPGALYSLFQYPSGDADILTGFVQNIDSQGNPVGCYGNFGFSARSLLYTIGDFAKKPFFSFHQPGVWIKTSLIRKVQLDTTLNCVFDLDLLIRLLAMDPSVVHTKEIVSCFRFHEASKTCSIQSDFYREAELLRRRYLVDPAMHLLWKAVLDCEDSACMHSRLLSALSSPGSQNSSIFSIVLHMLARPGTRISRNSLRTLLEIYRRRCR